MTIPSIDASNKAKIQDLLAIQNAACYVLLPHSEYDPENDLDANVKQSAEATYIKASHVLDVLMDRMLDFKSEQLLIDTMKRSIDAQGEAHRQQALSAQFVRRPSVAFRPEIVRVGITQWAAIYGDSSAMEKCVIGTGLSPEEAMRDFDREFLTRQKAAKSTQSKAAPATKGKNRARKSKS